MIDANVGLTVLARLSRESDNIVVVTVVALIPTADSVIIPKMMPTARLDQEGDMSPSISMSRSTEESRGAGPFLFRKEEPTIIRGEDKSNNPLKKN